MKDFSQTGEQGTVLEWARTRQLGRFLDIGAADGITASNTHALASTGWRGVCVEAAACMFDKLVRVYNSPGFDGDVVECLQAAVVPNGSRRIVPFHYSHDLVSTTEQTNADTWAEFVAFSSCHVTAVGVDELLQAFPGPYDMVSIDTEGTSVELWDELRRLDVFTPGALVIVEAEDGGERWEIQQACPDGWARVGVTPNNVILERL